MDVNTFEKKEKNTAELTVLVTAAEFNDALNEVYQHSKRQISVPGFRKGKAPRKIIENVYGADVFHNDAFEIVLPDACTFGVTEKGLNTVGYPEIQDVKVNDDKSVTVAYVVTLYPEVTLGAYKGLTAVKSSAAVTEGQIDAEIAGVRLRNARIETVDTRPLIGGDTAVLDFEGFVDGAAFEGGKGEDYELKIGSNSFIPGFEQQMQGMRTGEERELNLTFPEDYNSEALAGKPAVFKVKLKEIRTQILPEEDDEFAKDVSEFDTIAEYREDIRKNLLVQKEKEVADEFDGALIKQLVEGMEGEIPDAMIELYIDNAANDFRAQLTNYGMELAQYLSMSGTTEEAFRENMRPNAVSRVKTSLALEKIAELEGFAPTEEELENTYKELAEQYLSDIDDIKEQMSVAAVTRDINARRALALVRESATATEPSPEVEKPAKAAPKKPAKPKAAKAPPPESETASLEPAAEPKTVKK
ncbi:MAG: trigger factor, partial [Oscillospiraceae bacterium]|nr:trigger factor [Oscillospiraceae bacterium]